jgi:hypothetical protein
MKKYLAPLVTAGLVAGAGVGALAASPVFAQSDSSASAPAMWTHAVRTMPHDVMFFHAMGPDQLEEQAELLGISADDLLARQIKGETFPDIVKSLGISQEDLQAKMKARHEQHIADLKTRVQALVSSGKITQAEADAYIAKLTTPPVIKPFDGKLMRGKMQHFKMMAPPSTP